MAAVEMREKNGKPAESSEDEKSEDEEEEDEMPSIDTDDFKKKKEKKFKYTAESRRQMYLDEEVISSLFSSLWMCYCSF